MELRRQQPRMKLHRRRSGMATLARASGMRRDDGDWVVIGIREAIAWRKFGGGNLLN
jgi:hypothetical protein